MNKLTVFGKLVIALGIPMMALACCLLVLIVYEVSKTLGLIIGDWRKARAKRRDKQFELDSDEVDRAAREYFTKPYEDKHDT